MSSPQSNHDKSVLNLTTLRSKGKTPVEKKKDLALDSAQGWKHWSVINYESSEKGEKSSVIQNPLKAGGGWDKSSSCSISTLQCLTKDYWKTPPHKTKETNEYSWNDICKWLIMEAASGSAFQWAQLKHHCKQWNSVVLLQGVGMCLNLNWRNKVPIIPLIGSNKAGWLLCSVPCLLPIFKSPI